MCELYSAPSFRGVQVGRILQLLGRITHNGCKKLEGPLQKAALVSTVCNFESRRGGEALRSKENRMSRVLRQEKWLKALNNVTTVESPE